MEEAIVELSLRGTSLIVVLFIRAAVAIYGGSQCMMQSRCMMVDDTGDDVDLHHDDNYEHY
eukprot:846804-Amphidinium_carterae.1